MQDPRNSASSRHMSSPRYQHCESLAKESVCSSQGKLDPWLTLQRTMVCSSMGQVLCGSGHARRRWRSLPDWMLRRLSLSNVYPSHWQRNRLYGRSDSRPTSPSTSPKQHRETGELEGGSRRCICVHSVIAPELALPLVSTLRLLSIKLCFQEFPQFSHRQFSQRHQTRVPRLLLCELPAQRPPLQPNCIHQQCYNSTCTRNSDTR
mmetsp:Transcript_18679/g.58733  ORF Transcript_18679/g.58733 Transcript_18679/m.58733 type:complete len:206 (+) Transcript_18679:2909-3526(+)